MRVPHPPELPRSSGATLIGRSSAISDVRTAVGLVARSPAAVLVTGESGTGKEIVARSIHTLSLRSARPFVAVNCAALPRDLIENELFGHEKGAFTGALVKKCGAFETADLGTLFFDEIAEMNSATQAKLLRVIETKCFRRLGGTDEIAVDVRIVGATNRDIAAALAAGDFRRDLYHRFSVIEIFIPPLRERAEDIPPLLDHFLRHYAGNYETPVKHFSEAAMRLMLQYTWPGNVRELRNVVERSVVMCRGTEIGTEILPPRIQGIVQGDPRGAAALPIGGTLRAAEQIILRRTLQSVGFNVSRASRVLGLSRTTIHKRMREYGIRRPETP